MAEAQTDATIGIIAGKLKTGKTVALIAAFPEAVFVAAPNALDCGASLLGWDVPRNRRLDLVTIRDVTKAIPSVAKVSKQIVIDDLSIMGERTVYDAEKVRKLKGWKIWDAVRDDLLELRATALRCGLHVWFSSHLKGPKGDRLGGPDLPGQMPESFPAVASCMLRVVYDPAQLGGWPWALSAVGDGLYAAGDRLSIVKDRTPMNVREILLASGRDIPRPKALAWMDKPCAALAARMAGQTPQDQMAIGRKAFDALVKAGRNPLHVRWLCRDAIHRTVITAQNSPAAMADSLFAVSDMLDLTSPAPAVPAASQDGDGDGAETASTEASAPVGSSTAVAPKS